MARDKPDLILHVGDYYYRELPCPAGQQKQCGGSPYGDNWPSWKADFFDPGAPLLASAPWIFVRGNHEECARAGAGRSHFLDAGAYSMTCNDDPRPYAAPLPGLTTTCRRRSGSW